jgi:hypothetical protein
LGKSLVGHVYGRLEDNLLEVPWIQILGQSLYMETSLCKRNCEAEGTTAAGQIKLNIAKEDCGTDRASLPMMMMMMMMIIIIIIIIISIIIIIIIMVIVMVVIVMMVVKIMVLGVVMIHILCFHPSSYST